VAPAVGPSAVPEVSTAYPQGHPTERSSQGAEQLHRPFPARWRNCFAVAHDGTWIYSLLTGRKPEIIVLPDALRSLSSLLNSIALWPLGMLLNDAGIPAVSGPEE